MKFVRNPKSRRVAVGLMTLALVAGLGAAPGWAQGDANVDAEPVSCLPIGENGVAWASVQGVDASQTPRLNFRRLNDVVEDFYYVEMQPAGQGRYWGVFPQAADEVLKRHDVEQRRAQAQEEATWAEWWREKDSSDHRDPNGDLDGEMIRERASQGKAVDRHWLAEMDDVTFQNWLEQLENEPAEYFVSLHDATGREVARSKTQVAEVKDDCRVDLTPAQRGEAENLTVGESAYWQRGEEPFHWRCDGIVTRVDPSNVKRGDGICRACVIAWWERPGVIVPIASGVGALAGYGIFGGGDVDLVDPEQPPPASPSEP